MSENSTLILKSINQLIGERFYIPSYQRGYRWTETQVKELLNDIWDFAMNPTKHRENKEKPFYCLQPIVVKNKDGYWEVIDGQQRLTTIFLILKNLEQQIERDEKNITEIKYQTRTDSKDYLHDIDVNLCKDNIDFYHIYIADQTIKDWFKNIANTTEEASPKARFAPVFLSETKVIWYEVESGTSDKKSYDIFTRLNVGKIQLTNSELIKALFLRRWSDESEDYLRMKQLQIAGEWDKIEYTLRDDSFWYFIRNKDIGERIKYPNRIEYVFDLIQKKPEDAEDKLTFYKFNDDFEFSKKNSDKNLPDTDALWMTVKRYFLRFEEWYNDRELYHLIGYLIATGFRIEDIIDPKIDNKAIAVDTKTQFRNYLIGRIQARIESDFEKLTYGDNDKIKRILLLFNIETILLNKNSNLRFPFDKYKIQDWDIEHIRSQTDKEIRNDGERRDWTRDILFYFTGKETTKEQTELVEKQSQNFDEKTLIILQEMIELLQLDKINDSSFNQIYSKVSKIFEEENEPSKAAISNLTLLDSTTNRSYKNAYFPIKRKVILKNDMTGTFIPICTKNIFMKAYSSRPDKMLHWNDSDAQEYLNEMKRVLDKYIKQN